MKSEIENISLPKLDTGHMNININIIINIIIVFASFPARLHTRAAAAASAGDAASRYETAWHRATYLFIYNARHRVWSLDLALDLPAAE